MLRMNDIVSIINRRIATALTALRLPFRGRLTRISTRGGVMTAQLQGLEPETLQEVEVFQHYGLTTVPPEGAGAVIIPLGGKTSHGVVIATEHGQYRVRELQGGEVALYTDEGVSITLHKGKKVAIHCDDYELHCKNSTVHCERHTVNASKAITMDTPQLTATKKATVKGLFTGSGGASFTGNIGHTGGTFTTVKAAINGVDVGMHNHTTSDGDSGPMKNP